MDRMKRIYLPSLSIAFLLTMLFTCFTNLVNGYHSIDVGYILELFGLLAAAELIDALLGYVNFKSYRTYFLAETVIIYGVMLLCAYFGNWFAFTVPSLSIMTAAYLCIMFLIHFYFYRCARQNADQINRKLK